MAVKHATTAVGTDAGTGEVHKAEWNANHTIDDATITSAKLSLTSSDAVMAGDFTMTTASTNYDVTGLSQSLAAGTWLLLWKLLHQAANQPVSIWAKLWDGTTVYDEVEGASNLNGYRTTISSFVVVTLGSPATLKVTTRADANGQVIKRDGGNGTIHVTSRFTAIRIG